MDDEFASMMNLKQLEISQAQKSYDQQIGSMGMGMSEEWDKLKEQNEEWQEEIQEMQKKVSKLEIEVESFKSGIEGVKQQVQEKQNNPKVAQLTELLKQKDQIPTFETSISKLKMEAFDLERKVCDIEFENDQKELKLWK